MLAADYPYLLGSLLMLLAFALGAVLSSGQRRPILASAVLSAPYACSSVLFVPEYWEPRRIASFVAGPEDILFSFAGGGLVWMLAAHLVSPRPAVSLSAGRVARRYLSLSFSFFALVLALVFALGLGIMAAVVTSGGVLFVVLLALRPDLGRLAALTGVGYCAGYTLFCAVLFALWPHFLEQWRWENLSGLTFLSVPVEESVWALVFATCWTLAMGYAFQVRLPERVGVGRHRGSTS